MYRKGKREIKRQEKNKEGNNYWREDFPERFVVKKLYGWDDKKYDREYWNRIDRNQKKWERTKPLKQRKLETIKVEKEYQGRKIKDWDKEQDKEDRLYRQIL